MPYQLPEAKSTALKLTLTRGLYIYRAHKKPRCAGHGVFAIESRVLFGAYFAFTLRNYFLGNVVRRRSVMREFHGG